MNCAWRSSPAWRWAACPASPGFVAQAEAQTNRLAAVADAMGATNLNSIEYKGSGLVFSFGQAYEPGERWPRFIQRVYDASINYQTPAMRLVQVRSQGEHPPRGGGAQAVAADQRTVQVVSGKFAWQEAGNQAVPNAAATAGAPAAPVGDAARRGQGGARQWRQGGRQHHHREPRRHRVQGVGQRAEPRREGELSLDQRGGRRLSRRDRLYRLRRLRRREISAPHRADRGRISDLRHHRRRR